MDPTYVTRTEFTELKTEVSAVAQNVNHLVMNIDRIGKNMDDNMHTLVSVLSGQSPEKCVPLDTHKLVIKGILTAFTIIIVAVLGLTKFIPIILNN